MQRLLRRVCHAANRARERGIPLKPQLIECARRYDAIVAEGLAFHEAHVDPNGGCAPDGRRLHSMCRPTLDPREEPGALAALAGFVRGAASNGRATILTPYCILPRLCQAIGLEKLATTLSRSAWRSALVF